MADAQLQSALAHWAPRLIANGIPLADFQDVTSNLDAWEGWCRAWVARGEVHEQLGEADLARGWRLSAGEHFTRAAVCHHFAKFVFVEDLEQMRWAHLKAVAARRRALPLIAPPGEAVEIPYLGGTLKGELRRPEGGDRPPVVVMCMGLDSCKEEMDAYERNFLDRGMATLAFDGPGQGEAEYDHPIRGDYEVPVAAVFDWLQTRSDFDASRAALWGVSLGGTTRRGRPPSRSARAPASHSPAPTTWAPTGTGCPRSPDAPSRCGRSARPRPRRAPTHPPCRWRAWP